MQTFEEKFKKAQDEDKIIYYDYIMYKRALGWQTGFINDDWLRPTFINRARYDASFLVELPNYYFLGFPVKEIIKSSYANGRCHACSLALSLCFKNFTIITANLKAYLDFYNRHFLDKLDEFEHTFLLTKIKGKNKVIDTTFGLITSLETYDFIFTLDNIRKIDSSTMQNLIIYQDLLKQINYIGPSYDEEIKQNIAYRKYYENWQKLENSWQNFKHENKNVETFINRCLYNSIRFSSLDDLRYCLEYKPLKEMKITYPKKNMISLKDDQNDELLDGYFEDTKAQNAQILLKLKSKKH